MFNTVAKACIVHVVGIPADDMKWHLYQIIIRDVLTKKRYRLSHDCHMKATVTLALPILVA